MANNNKRKSFAVDPKKDQGPFEAIVLGFNGFLVT